MKLRSYLPAGLAGVLALGTLTAGADYAATLSSLNPEGWWRLNEPGPVPPNSAANLGSLGTAGDGTYSGSVVRPAPGALVGSSDTAATFSGGNMAVPYNAGLNPEIFTIEAWLKPALVFNGLTCPLASMRVAGPRTGWNFYQSDDGWNFRTYNQNDLATAVNITASDFLIADQWYHVVATWDGSVGRLYVNGVLGATSDPTNFTANAEAAFTVGARSDGAFVWQGDVDEVAFYPTVLSEAHILEHYTNGINPAPSTSYDQVVLAKSPVGYWRLNEPAYSPLVAVNAGSLGSAQDGAYSTSGAIAGVPGPQLAQFAGFEADNLAVALNGTSGDVTIPALNWFTDTITFAAWVNLERYGPADLSGVVFSRGSSATGIDIRSNGELRYHWLDGMWGYSSGLFVPTNQWVFVALAVEPSQAVLYMGTSEGLLSRTNAVTHNPGTLGDPLYLGRDQPARRLAGRLDEAVAFNSTLDYDTISNLFYSATPAILNVARTPPDPVFEGMNVEFTAHAVSSAPLNYQWRKDGSLVGGDSPVLTLNNVSPADDGSYDVVVTAGSLSVTSVVDVISVVAGPPVVFTDPVNATRYEGGKVTFTVEVGGTTPFTYQWYHGAAPITDATNATYHIEPISAADAGDYFVRVSNPNGTIDSDAATLTVLSPPNSYSQVLLQNQPEAYWRLNETSGTTAFDYAGGLHGTFPAPPPVVPGVDGPSPPEFPGFESDNTAFLLAEANGWVTCPALNWNTNTVTFTAWVKLNNYGPGDLSGVVFSRGSSANGIDIRSNGELRYHWNDGHWGFSSGITVPLDTWVFLALVVEPSQARLYMGDANGLSVAVNNATHDVTALADPLYLGRDQPGRRLDGVIDEAAVYKRALSDNDISALYATGFGISLEVSLTKGGYIEDTKPTGVLHHGMNHGTTWEASVTDWNNVMRTGVARFSTATPSQIVTGADPDFDNPTGTIMFWMKADAPIPGPGNEGAILFDRRTANGTVIVLNDAGAIFVQCAGGANSFAAGYLPDDAWRHVAVTYDQSDTGGIEIFVDGVSLGSNPNTAAWSWPADQPIEIGRSHDGYWKRYDGQMDDFRIYNRILTPAEITSASTGALVDNAALVVRYNFDNDGIGYTVHWPFGTLQNSPALGSPAAWNVVPGAVPPSHPILPTDPAMFFRATY